LITGIRIRAEELRPCPADGEHRLLQRAQIVLCERIAITKAQISHIGGQDMFPLSSRYPDPCRRSPGCPSAGQADGGGEVAGIGTDRTAVFAA
jgi:hypothetical protein